MLLEGTRQGAAKERPLLKPVQIAHGAFPIPSLPPPLPPPRLLSPLASSPLPHSSPDADKENAPAEPARSPDPGELPGQIAEQLTAITAKLETFTADAPHTIQRLAELVLQPRAHYRALATYLHAVDRVVQVTSGTAVYPLPPAVPDMSAINGGGGDEAKDPAATVLWSNPTTAALGSDEALGGALLTPIPWLTRRSPDGNGDAAGGQIHSEGTQTIEGPNGVGSVETVSVSVNGVPSTGHARGVTQGELLLAEQRAGVVPVSQLARGQDAPADDDGAMDDGGGGGESAAEAAGTPDHEDEAPHARGPEEIGVNDTGPQTVSTSCFGQDGVQMRGIDVEAAVGRRHDDGAAAAGGPRAKREAEQDLESDVPKKAKESGGGKPPAQTASPPPAEAPEADEGVRGRADAASPAAVGSDAMQA